MSLSVDGASRCDVTSSIDERGGFFNYNIFLRELLTRSAKCKKNMSELGDEYNL